MRRPAFILLCCAAASCFDPLYEDSAPITSGWVVCCQAGAVNTCFCDEATSCQQSLFPCAAGTCSSTPVCIGGGTGGGSSAGGGAGGGGAAAGGGAGTGGGASGGGGGTTTDAGTTVDAGVIDAGTGGGTGGGAGGGGGGGASTAYEFCCTSSRVTTCACPATGCPHEPFTPCPGGGCIAGSSTAVCR